MRTSPSVSEKEVTAMGETNQGETGASGRRPARPTPPAAHGSAVLTPPTGLPAVGAPAPSVPAQRTSPDPTTPIAPPPSVPAPPVTGLRLCVCGHPDEMHEHYRAGDDCGACGPQTCGTFRARADESGVLGRTLRRLRG